ncbi:MBG domain-containing protein [Loigolactobacillus bifermentans]|uniref:MBG domain-containing protein n=2 Tax=Loigolactobacillus bifermentans TaxID=1607 RepID=UPI001961F7D5|nr:MBG domain-containing protein [Loigolactobacillus bifermentans]
MDATFSTASTTPSVPTPTSSNGIAIALNGGSQNVANEVIFDKNIGQQKVTVSGSFAAGDTLIIDLGTTAVTNVTAPDISGTKASISGDQVTYTFKTAVAAVSTDVYFKLNTSASVLSDGQQYTILPITVTLNGTTVATNSLILNKTYTQTSAPNQGYNLYGGVTGGSIVNGLIKDGQVVNDIQNNLAIDGLRYPGDYSTIMNQSAITQFTADSTVTITFPDTVKITASSIDASALALGYTMTVTGNTAVLTIPAGMHFSDMKGQTGFMHFTLQAVTTPTGNVNYGMPTIVSDWFLDQQEYVFTNQSDQDPLQYIVATQIASDGVGYDGYDETLLPLEAGNTGWTWSFGDTSNYVTGNLDQATLTMTNSNPDSPMGITGLYNLSDSGLATAGLSTDLTITFTTASGQQETMAYVSGQANYLTTLGSASDPVVGITLKTNKAVTSVPAKTIATRVGLTSYGTAATTVTMNTTFQLVGIDGTVAVAASQNKAQPFDSEPLVLLNGGQNTSNTMVQAGDTVQLTTTLTNGYRGNPDAGVVLSRSQVSASGLTVEAAYPMTLVVVAPLHTTFASDSDILNALVKQKIVTNVAGVTLTHLADENGQQRIAIAGINNYLISNTLQIPVMINADTLGGTTISSTNTIYVEPNGHYKFAGQTAPLASLGSLEADLAAGNMYNLTSKQGTMATVMAASVFQTTNAVQGSADSGAQVSTGTIRVDDDQAVGKTILTNGSNTDITDNLVFVLLGDGVSLTGPVTVTDQDGNAVTGYHTTYTTDAGATTDPTQAVGLLVSGLPVAAQTSLIISYPLTLDTDQLQGALSDKSWTYLTRVEAYTGGTYDIGQQFGSDIDTNMTLKAVQNVTDSWYIALDTGVGTPQPAGTAITTTGLVGTSYNAFQVTGLGSLTVGQALPDAPEYIFKGMYDPSTGTYLSNDQLITYQEQVAADGSVSGHTYYMVLGERYSTQVISTDYTVHYTGAGTATPADHTQAVVWTGTTDAVTGTTTWVPSSASVAVSTPTVTGYQADVATAYEDALATVTTQPSSVSVTVTYTPAPLTQPTPNTATQPANPADVTANPQLATSIVVQGASKVYDNDASTDPTTFTVLAPSQYSDFVVPTLTAADFDLSGVTSQNVGLYQVTLSASGLAKLQAANPTFTFDASDVQNGLFQITPAAITITAPTVSKTYDGKAYTATLTASVSNLPTKGVTPVYSLTDVSTAVAAGDYLINVNADPTANSNYTITTQSGQLTITPATLTAGAVTVGSASKVYDNDASTDPTTYTVTLADGLTAPTTWTASDFDTTGITSQNVGQYAVTLSASGIAKLQALNPNVTVDGVTAGALTITAAPVTITANGVTKIYDGTAYTKALTASISGNVAAGDTLAYSLTDVSADVNAGTYAINVVLGDNPNYQITTASNDLTISPALVQISGPTVSKTYDGKGYTDALIPTITGLPANGAALNYQLADVSANTQVGSYAIAVTLDANPNYTVTASNGLLTITPAPVQDGSLQVSTNTKVYDNDASTDPTVYTVTLTNGLTEPTDWTAADFTRTAGENVGSYDVNLSAAGLAKLQAANTNYALTATSVAAGALMITPAPVSLTAVSASKVYDGTAYTGDLTPLISGVPTHGEAVTYTVTDLSAAKNAGTYTIDVTPTANANYSFTTMAGQLTITKAPVTITVPTVHKTYDGTNQATVTATVTGVPTAGQPVVYTLSDLSQAIDAGTYSVAAITDPTANANYAITTESGALIIDPLAVTITGPTVTKTYDGNGYTAALTATVTSATGMAAQPDYSLTDVSGETAVGSYTIAVTPSATTNNANYSITTVAGHLTITPVSVQADSIVVGTQTKVYDGDSATDPTAYDVTLSNGLTTPTDWTSTDFVRSDTSENAGTYAVTLSATGLAKLQAANPNYTVTAADVTAGSFTITPAPITITAPTLTKVYDGQAVTTTLAATVAGQPAKGVTPVYQLTDVSGAVNAGQYPIAVTATDAANANYTITTVPGSLTITPASVGATSIQLGDQTKTYDGDATTDPATYDVTLSNGLLAPATDWEATDFQRAGSSENVGTYDVTLSASGLAKLQAANPNYTVTAADVQAGHLTITPANVTITAPTITKVYDGNGYSKTLTATIVGQPANGAALNYTLTDVSTATHVGDYTIDVTADPTANQNYNITTQSGSLTITPANVATDSIKVGNQTKVYDGDASTDPTTYDLTASTGVTVPTDWTSDDFVRSDASENAGSYDVTLSASGLAKLQAANLNYVVTAADVQAGQLPITPATITITAPTVTKVYDGKGVTSALTATVSGQPEKGVAPVYALTDVRGETNVGTYTIDVTADPAANQNYNIVTKSGSLTITPASVATDSIKVGNQTKVYDGDTATDPTIYDVTLNGLTAPTDWTSTDFVRSAASENVGSYAVTLSTSGLAKLQAANSNYTITATDVQAGQLTITPAAITITAPTVTKVYDGKGATAALTATVSGQPEKGTAPVYTLTDISDETNVGTYTIDVTADQTANQNYNIVTKSGSLTITPASVATDSIKVGNQTKVYDGDSATDPTTYAVTLNGLMAPTDWTSDDFARSDASENAGSYDVTLSTSGLAKLQAVNLNYTITADDVQAGQLTITPAELTITAPTVTKVYDGKGVTGTLTATVSGQPEKGTTPVYTLTDVSDDTNVGTYTIDVTADPTANQNYNVTTQSGSLTITPASVATDSIKVGNQTKVYDGDSATDPTTYAVTLNGLTAPTDWTSDDFARSDASENAGSYDVTLSTSGLAKLQAVNLNYTITADDVQAGQLTITPAELTITAPTITKAYDGKGVASALTATVSGQPEKGIAPVYTLTDVSDDTNVGTYTIDVIADPTANQNYNIVTKSGSLTITPASVATDSIKVGNQTKVYDGDSATDPTTYAVTLNGLTAPTDWTSDDFARSDASENAGSYDVTLSASGLAKLQAANPNYTITADDVQAGQLTITPATITITAPTVTKVYDGKGATVALTATVSGQPEKGTAPVYTLTDVSGETNVGTYTIDVTADPTANTNYSITTTAGNLTITPQAIGYTLGTGQVTYDGVHTAASATDLSVTLANGQQIALQASDITVAHDSTALGQYQYQLSAAGQARIQALLGTNTALNGVAVGQIEIVAPDTDNNGGTTTPGGTDNGGQPGDNNGDTTTPGGTDNGGQPSDNNGGTTTPGGTDNGGQPSDNSGTTTPSSTGNGGQSSDNNDGTITSGVTTTPTVATTNHNRSANDTVQSGTAVDTTITPTVATKTNTQPMQQTATTLPQTSSETNSNLMLLGLLLISLTGFIGRFGKRKVG